MQGGRGGGDPFFNSGDPFASFGGFGGFGGQRNMLSSFLGGRDPFDDPFFTRPFGSMFGPSMFGSPGGPFPNMPTGFIEHQVPQPNRSRGPIIEEINSDDEKEDTKEKKENPRKHGRSSNEPYVEDPDDEAEERKSKHMQYRNDYNRLNNLQAQPQARSFSFQSSSVTTYGGPNGAYYTSSRTKRTGSDGVMIDESKEADTITGEATHKIARGIHDKGHSTTRKLNADGKVDTMQTLHNLDEDELTGFEEAWKGNAGTHLPGWTERLSDHDNIGSSSRGQNVQPSGRGWALPSTKPSEHSKKVKPDQGETAGSSRSQKPEWKKAFNQKF